jgi:hypothetical protein
MGGFGVMARTCIAMAACILPPPLSLSITSHSGQGTP